MELINSTCVPAQLTVARLPGSRERAGILTAKATFRMAPPRFELDRQAPMPLVREPKPTELGELPPDFLPRSDERFEVMLLGCAYGPGGSEVRRRTVTMWLGNVRRELLVTGDRVWQQGAEGRVISEPQPFTRMPLTWERAFGGTARVELAPGVSVRVPDPINPAGRGFDPLRALEPGARLLDLAEGYPRVLEPRLLPNVEAPNAPVERPEDVPAPACWAPLPVGSMLRVDVPDATAAGADRMGMLPGPEELDRPLFNACKDWIVDMPKARARLALEGLTEEPAVACELPDLRVVADYASGERQGALRLQPISLVVFAEDRRATITYRALFRSDYEPTRARTLRLRLEPGWYSS